jgi:hypothetical protein
MVLGRVILVDTPHFPIALIIFQWNLKFITYLRNSYQCWRRCPKFVSPTPQHLCRILRFPLPLRILLLCSNVTFITPFYFTHTAAIWRSTPTLSNAHYHLAAFYCNSCKIQNSMLIYMWVISTQKCISFVGHSVY